MEPSDRNTNKKSELQSFMPEFDKRLVGHLLDHESAKRVMDEVFAPAPETDRIYAGFNFDEGLRPGPTRYSTKPDDEGNDVFWEESE